MESFSDHKNIFNYLPNSVVQKLPDCSAEEGNGLIRSPASCYNHSTMCMPNNYTGSMALLRHCMVRRNPIVVAVRQSLTFIALVPWTSLWKYHSGHIHQTLGTLHKDSFRGLTAGRSKGTPLLHVYSCCGLPFSHSRSRNLRGWMSPWFVTGEL